MYNLSITTHWFLSGSLHVTVEWEIALCSFGFVSDRLLSTTLLWMVLDSTRYYLLYAIASHILFHYNGYPWLFQVCGITMAFFSCSFNRTDQILPISHKSRMIIAVRMQKSKVSMFSVWVFGHSLSYMKQVFCVISKRVLTIWYISYFHQFYCIVHRGLLLGNNIQYIQ